MILIAVLTMGTACNSLNSAQQAEYDSMIEAGYQVQEKSPGLGAVLGILPGGGSFYTRDWALGVVDLLVWPYSIFWDPFVGYENSKYLNYQETKRNMNRKRKFDLDELEEKYLRKEMTQDDYKVEKIVIKRKYNFRYAQ